MRTFFCLSDNELGRRDQWNAANNGPVHDYAEPGQGPLLYRTSAAKFLMKTCSDVSRVRDQMSKNDRKNLPDIWSLRHLTPHRQGVVSLVGMYV